MIAAQKFQAKADLRKKVEPPIVVNLRSMTADLSGIQRYVGELRGRLGKKVQSIAPARPLQGVRGHLWEQCYLPAQVHSRLLWSPANTGPLFLRRQVVTVHDIAVLDHPEWFAARFAAWYRWTIPRLVRCARSVIAVSEFTKSRLIERVGADRRRIAVIPNGVDARFRPCSAEAIEDARRHLEIPTQRYVLSLGTLEPRKNLRCQLQAWSRCVERLPADIWLVVAGRAGAGHIFAGTNAGQIPNRVHFAGFVPDALLPALYSGALALLYPSIYEGFGLPVVEAMASGTVPITSNSTALPEVVGNAGITVDPLDADAIANAIELLVTDVSVRQTLRDRGLERGRLFTWQSTASQTWEVLREASAR
jgi:glycosyltransferase involved in cell wall biosynthesis